MNIFVSKIQIIEKIYKEYWYFCNKNTKTNYFENIFCTEFMLL